MTTACLPCETMAAATDEDAPEVPEAQRAEWSGPIGMENNRTGDGRLIEANALRWDTLPVPLRWAMQDFGAHDGAYVVGKIEEIERLSFEEANERLVETGRDPLPERFEDATIIWGSGVHDLGSEHGREAHRQAEEGLTPGVSMDLDDIVVLDDAGDEEFTISEGRVRAATQVAIPAFEGARISVTPAKAVALGGAERMQDVEDIVDGSGDGAFNWVEDVGGRPEYIKRIADHLEARGMDTGHATAVAVNAVKKMCASGDLNFPGAQQVNAGSRAEACAAVAEWEAKKAKAKADSAESVTASAAGRAFPRAWFQDPGLREPTPLTVTDDGRVFGHVALWGTCHIANPQGPKVCTQPPRSASNYSYFNTHAVRTDAGDVYAGRLTMDTLHAGQRLSSTDAVYHYEHTGSVGAYVVAGEDHLGIWVAGAAHPKADVASLRAAPVSGDWRTIGRGLEMVGVLSVNVPGFPVPRARALVAGGAVRSLVASGVLRAEEGTEEVGALGLDLSDDAVLALRGRLAAIDKRQRVAALAADLARSEALARVERTAAALRREASERSPLASARRRALVRTGPASYNGSMETDTGNFAYNPDQWRMPKGNPGAGQWIDMPDVQVDGLKTHFEVEPLPEPHQRIAMGYLDKAQSNAAAARDMLSRPESRGSDDLRNFATAAHENLLAVRSNVDEAWRQERIDDEARTSYRQWIDEARNALLALKNADLSLMNAETDIGSGDESLKASGAFAYNPDQWRVPKGNGRLSGRFVDMPDALVKRLDDLLASSVDSGGLAGMNDRESSMLDEAVQGATTSAQEAADALRAGDGDLAKDAAARTREFLDDIEAQLFTHADNGTIDEDEAASIGGTLEEVQEGVDALAESDLSLLGDEGIGAEDEGIGADGDGIGEGDDPWDDLLSPEGMEENKKIVEGLSPEDDAAEPPSPEPTGPPLDGPQLDSLTPGSRVDIAPADGGESEFTAEKQPDGSWKITESAYPDEVPLGTDISVDDMLAGGDNDVRFMDGPDDLADEGDAAEPPSPEPVGPPLEAEDLDLKQPGQRVDVAPADGGESEFTAEKQEDGSWRITESAYPDDVPLGTEVSVDDLLAGGDNVVRSVPGDEDALPGEDPGDLPEAPEADALDLTPGAPVKVKYLGSDRDATVVEEYPNGVVVKIDNGTPDGLHVKVVPEDLSPADVPEAPEAPEAPATQQEMRDFLVEEKGYGQDVVDDLTDAEVRADYEAEGGANAPEATPEVDASVQDMKDFLVGKGYGQDVVDDLTEDELVQDYLAEGGPADGDAVQPEAGAPFGPDNPNWDFEHPPGPDPDALYEEARKVEGSNPAEAARLREEATKIRKAMDEAERENGVRNAPASYDPEATRAIIDGGADAPAAEGPQSQARAAEDRAVALEDALMGEIDAGNFPEDGADEVGATLEALIERLEDTRVAVDAGGDAAPSLAAAQAELSRLEALLMSAADAPGGTEDGANRVGTALDDVFAEVERLRQMITGQTDVPFSARSYTRQWLGLRGRRFEM